MENESSISLGGTITLLSLFAREKHFWVNTHFWHQESFSKGIFPVGAISWPDKHNIITAQACAKLLWGTTITIKTENCTAWIYMPHFYAWYNHLVLSILLRVYKGLTKNHWNFALLPIFLNNFNADFKTKKGDFDEDYQPDDVEAVVLKQVVYILTQLFKSTLFLTKVYWLYSTNPINFYLHHCPYM